MKQSSEKHMTSRRTLLKRIAGVGVYGVSAVFADTFVSQAIASESTRVVYPTHPTTAAADGMSTSTRILRASSVPSLAPEIQVRSLGPTPGDPFQVVGSGFTLGRTISGVFTSSNGTYLSSFTAITNWTGTFGGFVNSYDLPLGAITVSVVESISSDLAASPPPVSLSTTFTNTDNVRSPWNLSLQGPPQILVGDPVTVIGSNFTPSANHTIQIYTHDGRLKYVIPVIAMPTTITQHGGDIRETISTERLLFGRVVAAIGPAGSPEILAFDQATIIPRPPSAVPSQAE